MDISNEEFFHDFRQELMAGAEANSDFQLAEFMEAIASELVETGFVEGFEFCHYRAQRGMRVDGYWFNDEDALDLFIADFESRSELGSLTQTDANASLKRLTNFFESSRNNALYSQLEETSPEYGLAREIHDRKDIRRVNLFLVSERVLSDRLQSIDDFESEDGIQFSHNIWDISRLHRQRSSRGHKEALDLNLLESFGRGIACIPAHLGTEAYPSYLAVMPGPILSSLYGKYGSRLLEQNVRSFLQARGKVNRGIRTTILNEPDMFFAYNNGITATAQAIETRQTTDGLEIVRIKDLQIVNGGQTTASLFHTERKDKASLQPVFVQMKLSVIDSEDSETIVPRISEYANTQNRVNAADFFSNHPFHIRIEEFSRRIWAPAQRGAQRETKWFYERARGQYADAQSKLTPAEQRRFKAEYPKPQMLTKTDLAKFENVWDDHPKWVNLGAQKNFARYAERIGKEWIKSQDSFNEYYFRRAMARALVFRRTEKLVSEQSWYSGGYRANIVAYAIAALAEVCKMRQLVVDFSKIWNLQEVYPSLVSAIEASTRFVNSYINDPPSGISNISEWAKKDACWDRIVSGLSELESKLPEAFIRELVSTSEQADEQKTAKNIQKIDDGINAQSKVFEIGPEKWARILDEGREKMNLSPKEVDILKVARQIPNKIPSERQSVVLIDLLERAHQEGIA